MQLLILDTLWSPGKFQRSVEDLRNKLSTIRFERYLCAHVWGPKEQIKLSTTLDRKQVQGDILYESVQIVREIDGPLAQAETAYVKAPATAFLGKTQGRLY